MNLLMLAPALFMLQVFDRVLSSGSRETLFFLLLGVGAALGLALGLDYLRSRLQGVVGNLIGDALLPVVARDVLEPRGAFADRPATEALRDVATVRGLFSAQGLLAVFDAPWAIVYIAVIWLAHPALGIAAACAAVLMLGLALLNDWLTRHNIEALQRGASRTQRYLEASMANAEVAEAMGMADALLARWQKMNARVLELQRPTARRSVALAAFTRTTRQVVQVMILAVGAYLVITQAATPGVMVATTILLGRALAPVEQIVASWKVLAEGRLALRRLRALLAALGAQPERMALPATGGALEAGSLILRAGRSDELILAGVSLSLAPGEALAIIGPSGAGKSSLLRVLAGLWQPSGGHVRLDGADLTQMPREAVGPHIGYVPQDVELFSATVGENIARMGEVNPAAVVAAGARRRCARDDPRAARRLRHARRAHRRPALARPAPAHRPGPRAVRRAQAAAARRAELQPRRRRRAGAQRRARSAEGQGHGGDGDAPHHAGETRRQDAGARSRPRQALRAGGRR